MKNGRPQAKDISDARVLAIAKSIIDQRVAADNSAWCFRWDFEENLPDFPAKVVWAKLETVVNRGLLDGCGARHNCRGDFELTDAGAELLKTAGLAVAARPRYPIERTGS